MAANREREICNSFRRRNFRVCKYKLPAAAAARGKESGTDYMDGLAAAGGFSKVE